MLLFLPKNALKIYMKKFLCDINFLKFELYKTEE